MVELGPHFTNGLWSDEEAKLSSTWRELKAVYLVLKGFSAQLEGHTVKWYTDNQNVVRIAEAGSRKSHLQDGAISIFEECFQHGIKLEMAWIPRCENEKADYLSRIVDYDDWQIDPNIFYCGQHTIDNFASSTNKQLEDFHSKFWSPGSKAIDSFTISWKDQMNWLVPPPYLVIRTIMQTCQNM